MRSLNLADATSWMKSADGQHAHLFRKAHEDIRSIRGLDPSAYDELMFVCLFSYFLSTTELMTVDFPAQAIPKYLLSVCLGRI